ncbi:MAG: hypothetical protein AAFX87_18695 [Bacteroidota bacterium]
MKRHFACWTLLIAMFCHSQAYAEDCLPDQVQKVVKDAIEVLDITNNLEKDIINDLNRILTSEVTGKQLEIVWGKINGKLGGNSLKKVDPKLKVVAVTLGNINNQACIDKYNRYIKSEPSNKGSSINIINEAGQKLSSDLDSIKSKLAIIERRIPEHHSSFWYPWVSLSVVSFIFALCIFQYFYVRKKQKKNELKYSELKHDFNQSGNHILKLVNDVKEEISSNKISKGNQEVAKNSNSKSSKPELKEISRDIKLLNDRLDKIEGLIQEKEPDISKGVSLHNETPSQPSIPKVIERQYSDFPRNDSFDNFLNESAQETAYVIEVLEGGDNAMYSPITSGNQMLKAIYEHEHILASGCKYASGSPTKGSGHIFVEKKGELERTTNGWHILSKAIINFD